jgi:hypothetical protein
LSTKPSRLPSMGKHDSDSRHSPSLDQEKSGYNADAQHAEQLAALDRFPDPDAGKSDEERALIVRITHLEALDD